MTSTTAMHTVVPGLHASAPEALGFGRKPMEIRAYLLERAAGNLLVYRSAALPDDRARVDDLGGVARQYLNHSHEASPACDRVSELFGAPVHVHADDAAETARSCTVGGTFSDRHRVDDDFEVIPAPGHTPGATAFLWDSPGHRVLFTGDTIFVRDGEWIAAVLDGVSDRERYLQSLELLRGLEFDVLVPGVAVVGQPAQALVDPAEGRSRIGAIIDRLSRGEDN